MPDDKPESWDRVGERLLLRLGVTAPEIADDERPDVNLVFVVDTSGSMDSDEKIGLVRESLRERAMCDRPPASGTGSPAPRRHP